MYWDLPGTIGDCRAVLGFTEYSRETPRKVHSDEKWTLQACKLPVKGTSEIDRTHECPANCLVHVWARKVVNCGISFDGRFATPATSIQLPNCSYLQNFWIIVSEVLRLQVQVRMRDNQRSGCSWRHIVENCSTNCTTRAVQSCKISCHGCDPFMAAGGPTTLRNNFQNATSILLRSFFQIAR